MSGASLSLVVEYDDANIRRMMRRLEKLGANMRVVFADIGEYLLISHRDRFENQVGPDGIPWEPLKEETKKRKKRNKDKILIEFGDLRDLLRYEAGDEELAFGTDRIYGATQLFGDDSRGIPARVFLGLSSDDVTEIQFILKRHLEEVILA